MSGLTSAGSQLPNNTCWNCSGILETRSNMSGRPSGSIGSWSGFVGTQPGIVRAPSSIIGTPSSIAGTQSNVAGTRSRVVGTQSNIRGTASDISKMGSGIVGSIQRDAASDVGGDVKVFALVDGRLALVEPALGNDGQRQLGLEQLVGGPARTTGMTRGQVLALFQ